MKKLIYIFTGITMGLFSCNIVDNPYEEGGAGPGDEQYNDTVYNDTTINIRRILLEEFTGHKCPNCPEGADIAKQIMTDHPEEFLSVAIHNSGSFSKPDTSDPSHPYPSNFETPMGEALRISYQFSSFPGGMLNRSELNGSVKVPYQQWPNVVSSLIADQNYMAPRFKMHLENIYNSKPNDKSLRVRYKVEALQNIQGNIAIVAYITESHIIAPQTDNRLSNSYVPDYEHNHVLRTAFPNSGDGKTLFTNPAIGDIAQVISENDEISVAIPENWVPDNLEVIVFLYNSDSGEIIHVESAHLTN